METIIYSYISAYNDRYAGKILVWEKREDGGRVKREIEPDYYFYVPDRLGTYESITGVRLKKITCTGSNDFDQACMSEHHRFESDIDPLERALQDNYSKLPAPKLSVGFIDIEVDYDEDIGFAGPANPYAPINALTLYNVDQQQYLTYALPPKSWTGEKVWQTPDGGMHELPAHLQYVRLFKTEKELLEAFLADLHVIDVLSGWNSEFYDIPYIGKRLELVFGGAHALSMLAFEGGPKPRWAEKARFKHSKNMDQVLELNSRIHLDYLALVRKFNLTTRQSFALNSVAKDELGEEKLHYPGTLAELYNNDFVKFLEYNKHDVTLLIRLDQKFKYIELANQMVHEATVNFKHIFGSVALIDSAIINFAHNKLNKIVFDKEIRPAGDPVEGALVMTPIPGFYRKIGAVDINSLYPSTIRSMNLSLERLVGQLEGPSDEANNWFEVTSFEDRVKIVKKQVVTCKVWRNALVTKATWSYENGDVNTRYGLRTSNDTRPQDDVMYDKNEFAWRAYRDVTENPDHVLKDFVLDMTLDGHDETLQLTVTDLIGVINENKYGVTAFGTLMDMSQPGLVPSVLAYWFNGRKEMQAEKKKQAGLAKKLEKTDPKAAAEAKALSEFYDMLQGVRKVLLNSTYGAMLNEFSRFGHGRIGASVTYTGRQINTHMVNTVTGALYPEGTGPKLIKHFDPYVKKDVKTGTDSPPDTRWGANTYMMPIKKGAGAIYGDTDSAYFTFESAVEGIDDLDTIIAVADSIADSVNESFPAFMRASFNCQPGYDGMIKANRELVCMTGIMQAKKKYMMLVVDKEGKRIEPGDDDELKTMGSDIRLSSTPELIRQMLKEIVMNILYEQPQAIADQVVLEFRGKLGKGTERVNPLHLASIVSIKELDEYALKWEAIEKTGRGKVKMPANARASINFNSMIEKLDLKDEVPIKSGQKIKILWLRPGNDYEFEAMAFNSDMEELPKWFTDRFEVDTEAMELKLVDQKVKLIFDALGWEVPTFQGQLIKTLLSFDD